MLRTLGGLELETIPFNRTKPLLLLAYLALEGPRSRRYLAELFWPEAPDPSNNLSVALAQLRPLGAIEGEEVLSAHVQTDVHLLREALAQLDLARVRQLYRGAFLEGVELKLGEELEEWVWGLREGLALEVYGAYARAARACYALLLPEAAMALLEEARRLGGVHWAVETADAAPDPTPLPRELRRVYWALALHKKRAGEVVPLHPEQLERLYEEGLLSSAGNPLVHGGTPSHAAPWRGAGIAPIPLGPELPLEAQEVALELARRLPLEEALPLYRQARALWTPADGERAGQALLAEAQRLLSENPLRALELLEEAPTQDSGLLRARALERLGRYREALEALAELPPSPQTQAVRANVHFRLGRVAEALQEAAGAALGDAWAQGEALNLQGFAAFGQGQYAEAARLFARAAVRFLASGETARQIDALNNRAIALFEGGSPGAEEVLQEALEAAGEVPLLRARVTLNLGVIREKGGQHREAEALYREALAWAERAGSLEAMGRALNNLGALYHRLGRAAEAEAAYRRALEQARRAQEWVLTAAVLANLAELKGDPATLEEAVRLLDEASYATLAERYRSRLQSFGAG